MKISHHIEFVEGVVNNHHADYLFSTHCFEEFLERHRRQLFEYEARHGKVDAERYWIEPLYVNLQPVCAIKESSERFTWFEVRLKASGPDFLWHMSPTPLVDRVPAGEHPTTWYARFGSNPLMPLGKIRDGEVSIFGQSEEDIQRSLGVLGHVETMLSDRVVCLMDQIELYLAGKRFADSGIRPTIF